MALFQSFGQGEFWSSNYTINRYAQLTASTKMSTNCWKGWCICLGARHGRETLTFGQHSMRDGGGLSRISRRTRPTAERILW